MTNKKGETMNEMQWSLNAARHRSRRRRLRGQVAAILADVLVKGTYGSHTRGGSYTRSEGRREVATCLRNLLEGDSSWRPCRVLISAVLQGAFDTAAVAMRVPELIAEIAHAADGRDWSGVAKNGYEMLIAAAEWKSGEDHEERYAVGRIAVCADVADEWLGKPF